MVAGGDDGIRLGEEPISPAPINSTILGSRTTHGPLVVQRSGPSSTWTRSSGLDRGLDLHSAMAGATGVPALIEGRPDNNRCGSQLRRCVDGRGELTTGPDQRDDTAERA